MREIQASKIKDAVAQLCIQTNILISPDIKAAMEAARQKEEGLARNVLDNLLENADIAKKENMPICQDTGMVVVFIEIGQDCHVVGGSIADAVNAGVALGYEQGYLRKSVVGCPLARENTKNNTPAVIHYEIVEGDGLKICVSPKGFGSENMSGLKMLKPSDGAQGVEDFVLQVVRNADSNPCPPIIVGVGIGGTMEKSALIAKKTFLREVGSVNPNPQLAKMEADLLSKINATGIGPGGLGGITTALAVYIDTYATHIAGLPVAVNIGCHVTRHGEISL